MRRFLGLFVVVALASCGGDGSGPALFPDISGTYDYSGRVDGVALTVLSGTMTIAVASREMPQCSGQFLVRVSGDPDAFAGEFSTCSVSMDGTVVIDFDSDFPHTGIFDGLAIRGNWVLRGATETLTGTFTAVKR